jgi:hypothetical protein
MAPVKVLYATPDGGVRRALREVVDNPDEFARLWQEVHASTAPTPALPTVDFPREMVIVASMGVQASVGSTIAITELRDHDSMLEVTVELRPFPCSIGWPMVTYPIVIVSVPSSRSTVVFQDRVIRESRDRDCP